MSKNRIVFIVGVILFLIPFLGFPSSWKTFFLIVSGLILISLSLSHSIKKRLHINVFSSHNEEVVPAPVDIKETVIISQKEGNSKREL